MYRIRNEPHTICGEKTGNLRKAAIKLMDNKCISEQHGTAYVMEVESRPGKKQ